MACELYEVKGGSLTPFSSDSGHMLSKPYCVVYLVVYQRARQVPYLVDLTILYDTNLPRV